MISYNTKNTNTKNTNTNIPKNITNIPKKWIGISSKNSLTYVVKNFISDTKSNYTHIKNIYDLYSVYDILNYNIFCRSPTSCYFLLEPLIIDNKKYFYVDQQELIKWYVKDDKYVYADFNEQTYIVANSISDFLILMNMENLNCIARIIKKI